MHHKHQRKSGSQKKPSGLPKKKKTSGPRIALHLPRDAQGLYTRGAATWEAIKADPERFPSPYPPAAEVEGDLQGLADALKAAEGGDPVAIAELRVAEDKFRQTAELLGKYVQSVVRAGPIEDAPAIISSVLMYESNVGKRAPRPELEVRQGDISGLVLLIARAVPSALVYYWEYSLDQEVWTAVPQTARTRTSVAGLLSGKVYAFRFRTFKRDGVTTEWSQVVTFLVK